MKELNVLKLENDRLRILARQDSLTGVLNRGAFEQTVNERLKEKHQGLLIMMDVNRFKYINDNHGHLIGDRVLQEMARVISCYFFKKDIVGRMGGDEFAVFMVGNYGKEMVESKLKQLNYRLLQAGQELGIGAMLKITTGVEYSKEGENFQTLYERADCAMRSGKRWQDGKTHFYKKSMEIPEIDHEIQQEGVTAGDDMKYVIKQLRENGPVKGVYCQEYDTFLNIYRFLERGLERTELRVQLILLTLTNQYGNFVALEEREFLIKQLEGSLGLSLRTSDVYTRYSCCQFLVMVVGASQDHMETILKRIKDNFQREVSHRQDVRLSASFYPLCPITVGADGGNRVGLGGQ